MSHTVLVVDDDPGVLDVIVGMLEDLGCEVTSAQSGPDALDRLRQNENISILITDINMPGMDGHELAELTKQLRPELKILQLSGREPRRGGPANDQETVFVRGARRHHAANHRRSLNARAQKKTRGGSPRAGRTKLKSMIPICRCFARRVNAANAEEGALPPSLICGAQGACFKSPALP
ncbi:response regulator [Bradyrhizobium japonicum]|uniref:response regulator n=1 Tax=Bradyrhizobium japonicum TaxID=375 RepID=UPI001FCDDB9C|nr:response regulator [Bradyrhizobium japonicum]